MKFNIEKCKVSFAGLNSDTAKFADDTKLRGSAVTVETCSTLQSDLNGIFQWSKTWGKKYNVDKLKYFIWGVIIIIIHTLLIRSQ